MSTTMENLEPGKARYPYEATMLLLKLALEFGKFYHTTHLLPEA